MSLDHNRAFIMELVAGAVAARGKEAFAGCSRRFHLLAFDVAAEFDAAARIYRSSRKAGVTPTGRVDCMIASVPRSHSATLLSCDAT
jgi:predicted nucleic acid-binding protein